MERPKFTADEMLGSLAKWLRIMGYDTSYEKDMTDTEILTSSENEDRFLLTRDKELAARAGERGLLVESDDVDEQLRQLMAKFHLSFNEALTRCSVCNADLERLRPQDLNDEIPPRVLERHRVFFRCKGCGQVYWKGSHWQNIQDRLQEIEQNSTGGNSPR